MKRNYFLLPLILLISLSSCRQSTTDSEGLAPDFLSAWPNTVRTFIGPEYWTNRLQDWQVNNRKIECLVSAPNRNVFLLTHELKTGTDTTELRIRTGLLNQNAENPGQSWFGFRLGIEGRFDDYRDNAVRGTGMDIGITAGGELFIGSPDSASATSPLDYMKELEVRLLVGPDSLGGYMASLAVFDPVNGFLWEEITRDGIPAEKLSGGIALVSDFTQQEGKSVWFADWQISGNDLVHYPERAYGPIMFSHYTLSRDIMKMTAQMAPVGPDDGDVVHLEVQNGDQWVEIWEAAIDPMSRTATMRVDEWVSKADVPYRLRYDLFTADGELTPYYWEGTVRKDPVNEDRLVVAGFTGNNDLGFPNKDLTDNVVKQNPDFLFFSGDQIYEGVGGFGVQRSPVDKSTLDYLRKWYIFGWTYQHLLKDRPSICIPDDHDVYHGNIWGEGGKATGPGGEAYEQQDRGGYKQPAEWVNMVQRTQTAHLPDPYDPAPVKQGIGVYYTDMIYGGISFAIIEDRKFKSAPKGLLPEADISNGWPQNREFDPKTEADVEGAVLLGDRQLGFLEHWSGDWSGGVVMKCLLSQTIFANVATLPEEEFHDKIVPRLRILKDGEYAPNDRPVSDMDSNGWPQTGRDKALRAIRKGYAFHLAGDQHLGSTIQYGVDEYGDAPWALCVPSVSNVWPRRWYPQEPGGNRNESKPKYTGDFEDGFGNKMTVEAVSNPVFTGREPSMLYDRATGYGIVKFDKGSRKITIECWPRDADPTEAGAQAKQYPGWPITIDQTDNYSRKPAGYLPTLDIRGMENPVVQVIREGTGEMIYTLRIKGDRFDPHVFEEGTYIVKVGEPGTPKMTELRGVKSAAEKGKSELRVNL